MSEPLQHEVEIFRNTVATAARMAKRGELAAGHHELVRGLQRAEKLAAAGIVGPTLVERYRLEIVAYCERWGVRPPEGA